MALLPTVKFSVSVACFVATLWGLKHAGMLGPEKLGPLKDRLMGLLGKGPQSVSFENYQHSTCQACLEAGKDFCISSNKCIQRATFDCKGSEDHITGDGEFALRGNPNSQHSMTCPPSHKKSDVDSKDCYFDKECHAKVDWEKISKIKGGFFGRLKMYKEKDDAGAVKQMLVKVHEIFREAGMPDDRIDYILVKWVKSVFPEALNKDKSEGEVPLKMCAIGMQHCKAGQKVFWGSRCGWIWEKCTADFLLSKHLCIFDPVGDSGLNNVARMGLNNICEIKRGFSARSELLRLQYRKPNTGNSLMLEEYHKKLREAGLPEDLVDSALKDWASWYGDVSLGIPWTVTRHGLQVGTVTIQRKCFASLMDQMRCMKHGQKVWTGRCGAVWQKCANEGLLLV